MSSVQLIFIVCSEARKAKLQKQIEDLNLDFRFPIHFLEGSVPSNSESFIDNESYSEYHKKLICCSRSHMRALLYASEESSPEFSVICEDDVALHKDNFVTMVEELVTKWDSLMGDDAHMLSIGWQPFRHYNDYIETKEIPIDSKYQLRNCFHYGTQAYIIKKSSLMSYLPIFEAPTFSQLRQRALDAHLKHIDEETVFYSPDVWLNRTLSQKVVFPLLAVEQNNCNSLIGDHGNGGNPNVWKNHFKDYEHELARFWSY